MCGISGIINKSNQSVDTALIKKINDLIIHRGPDGFGYYHKKNFAFGHRRLSILDLTSNGKQPMHYRGRFTITYNGEVYNYLEIRKTLEGLGHRFASDCDTEVILAAYAEWGQNCLSKFNGMWAFAIYDNEKNHIFFSRDRFGVKPLYYANIDNYFVFGSEIKQILALQHKVNANQKMVLESLLTSFYGHTDETFFDGVYSFPQSCYGYYNLETNELKIGKYYSLESSVKRVRKYTEDEASDAIRTTFEQSISLRLRSDVKVGTCLSGGLDSSVTSAVASNLYKKEANSEFIAIHAKSIDSERDESRYAVEVANSSGLDMHVVTPQISDFLDTIDEVVYTQEEPFGSPSMFMGWQVFRKANELGCKVMLNGQGGDEVLLGYERYYTAMLNNVSIFRFIPELISQVKNSKLSIKNALFYKLYFSNPKLRIRRLKMRSLVLDKYKNEHDYESIRRSAGSFKSAESLQLHEITKLQLPHLLRFEDRNSMRHSIETRLPFLDYRFVELALSLPLDQKIRDGWTKYILRKSMKKVVPKDILWRRDKLGFEAPERSWIGSSSALMKSDIKDSRILNNIIDIKSLLSRFDKLPLRERWRYFCLSRWEKKFSVNW